MGPDNTREKVQSDGMDSSAEAFGHKKQSKRAGIEVYAKWLTVGGLAV